MFFAIYMYITNNLTTPLQEVNTIMKKPFEYLRIFFNPVINNFRNLLENINNILNKQY